MESTSSNTTSDANADHVKAVFALPFHAIQAVDSKKQELGETDCFVEAYEQEVIKVNGFYVTKFQEIETRLAGSYSVLVSTILEFKRYKKQKQDIPQEKLATMVKRYLREKSESDLSCNSLIHLSHFAQQNVAAFKKIAKKYNKTVKTGSYAWLIRTMEKQHFYAADMNMLILGISDVYRVVNWIERKQLHTIKPFLTEQQVANVENNLIHIPKPSAEEKQSGMWVPPETFKRKCEKYWVESNHLVAVKVLLAKRIPILIFGKDHKQEDKKRLKRFGMRQRRLWTNKVPQFESSDDSDSQQHGLDDYAVGSLISSVYYDNEQHDIYRERINKQEGAILVRSRWYGQYSPAADMFFERKTHHDKKLSGEESVKERFEMPFKHAYKFCDGSWKYEEMQAEMLQTMSAKKVQNMTQLANQVQQAIVERKLHPTVRTTYIRTAFQDQKSNEFRATLDTHLCLSKEGHHNLYKNLLHEVPAQDRYVFPYAILELKFAMEETKPLQWISELIAHPGVRKSLKFSKFLHSSVVMYPQVKDIMEPSWLKKLEKKKKKKEQEASVVASDVHEDNFNALKRTSLLIDSAPVSMVVPQFTSSISDVEMQDVLVTDVNSAPKNLSPAIPNEEVDLKATKPNQPTLVILHKALPLITTPTSPPPPSTTTPTSPPQDAKKKKKKKKKQEQGPDISSQPFDEELVNAKKVTKAWIKTALSNERTLLAWLQPIIILLGVAISLMSLGGAIVQIFGIIIACLATVFCIYSLLMFHRRRCAIGVRGICGNDEPCGPTIMVLLVIGTLVVSMILTIVFNGSNLFKPSTTVALTGNDALLGAKLYSLQTSNVFSTVSNNITREFALQQFVGGTLSSLPKIAPFATLGTYTMLIKHEEKLVLAYPFDDGATDTIALRVTENLQFINNAMQRASPTVTIKLQYGTIKNIASFVPATVNYKMQYLASASTLLYQQVGCTSSNYTASVDVTLNAPASYLVDVRTQAANYFAAYTRADLLANALVLQRQSLYSVSYDLGVSWNSDVRNCTVQATYSSLADMMEQKRVPLDTSFSCALANKNDMASHQTSANTVLQYMCAQQ